jgi:hypothetical protein
MLRKFAGALIATALIAGPAFAATSADNSAVKPVTAAAHHHAIAKHAKLTKHAKSAKHTKTVHARKHAHKHVAHGKLHHVKQARHLKDGAQGHNVQGDNVQDVAVQGARKGDQELKAIGPLKRRLPFDRNVLVAARGLDQMPACREREVIAGHQHAIGGGAIEQRLARRHRGVAVDVEGRLPVGMPRKHRRVLRGVA